MRLLTTTIGVILGVFGVWLMASAQAPVTAATIAGKWTMSIDTPIGVQTRVLTVALDGKKLTGGMSREDGSADDKVEGECADGKLTFTMTFEGPHGSMSLFFNGAVAKDGSLSGHATLEGADTVDWTATRIKG
jgi:hypothetical protein